MIGHSTQRPAPGPITWGVLRGRKQHLACSEPDDMTLTWAAFNGPNHPEASEPCVECGRALSEIPDP